MDDHEATAPDDCAPHERLFFEGTSALKRGDNAQAEACFRDALALANDFAEAHANLGLSLQRRNANVESERHYRRALELAPDEALTHMNLGALLLVQRRMNEAEQCYLQAVALDRMSALHWSNLGVVYACMNRESDAERCYRAALQIEPDRKQTQFNLSYLLLRQARFEEGWLRFEARDDHAQSARQPQSPRWQGETLDGKTLLITHEAGHGDMIQFCRYVPLLKQRGAAHITLTCHSALTPLFATLPGVDRVIGAEDDLTNATSDYWTPLLSLPYRFQTRLDSIPARLPYLFAPSCKVTEWAARLPPGGFRVGLCWKGNPHFENDADRSLPSLQVLAPLAAVQGVSFVSLQKGAGADEVARAPHGMRLYDAAPSIDDFADTAAVVANLDLTVSVDTAIAHLAGALGKPCWLLLPHYKTDWRWLDAGTESAWYPNVLRLFRQTVRGEWTPVIERVCQALAQACGTRPASSSR